MTNKQPEPAPMSTLKDSMETLSKQSSNPTSYSSLDEILNKLVNWGVTDIVARWYQVDILHKPDSDCPFLRPDEAKAAIRCLLVRQELKGRLIENEDSYNAIDILDRKRVARPANILRSLASRRRELERQLAEIEGADGMV